MRGEAYKISPLCSRFDDLPGSATMPHSHGANFQIPPSRLLLVNEDLRCRLQILQLAPISTGVSGISRPN